MHKQFVLLAALGLAGALDGQKVEKDGAAWLAQYSEPAGSNIGGLYTEKEWGQISLTQAQGSREFSGKGEGWIFSGVVSGKKVFMLISHKGKVNYCAELDMESDKILVGRYSNGMMTPKSKTRPMRLVKVGPG